MKNWEYLWMKKKTSLSSKSDSESEDVHDAEKKKESENDADDEPETNVAEKQKWWKKLIANDEQSREVVIRNSIREFIFYIIFLVAITIVFIDSNTRDMYNFHHSMKTQFFGSQFPSEFEEYELKPFADIRTASDFWRYMEISFIDSVYNDYWYDNYQPVQKLAEEDRNILFENKLLGVPRIRQVRVRNNSCTIPDSFKKQFFSCYSIYSAGAEQKAPFGLKSGTAWTYSYESERSNTIYSGAISTYLPGGYHADLSLNANVTKQIILELKNNLWVDRGTRAIFVDFTVYNANSNLFCFVKIIFEFPPTGGVLPDMRFFVTSLLNYETTYDLFKFALLWIVSIYIFYFIALEIIEVCKWKWRYLLSLWSYVGVTIIGLFFSYVGYYVEVTRQASIRVSLVINNMDKYVSMDNIVEYVRMEKNLSAILLFFVWIKTFKYLGISKRLGQLNRTLKNAALDLLCFTIMFFIVFLAFSMLGYLLFGTQVDGFKTVFESIFTLLRTVLGDFDYLAIERADDFLGPLFFMCYIFLIFFILLNIFLAILIQAYSVVKYEEYSKNEFQVSDYLKNGFKKFLSKCCPRRFKKKRDEGKKQVENILEKITDALRKCNFGEMEIKLFLDKYNLNTKTVLSPLEIKKLLSDIEGTQLTFIRKDADGKTSKGLMEWPFTGSILDRAEFEEQINRLHDIEENTKTLADKVDSLLKKLDNLENIKTANRS